MDTMCVALNNIELLCGINLIFHYILLMAISLWNIYNSSQAVKALTPAKYEEALTVAAHKKTYMRLD